MGERGPKPKTAAQLARQGSKRANSRAKAEAKATPAPIGAPARPKYLREELGEIFDELARTLPNLRPTDGALVFGLATAIESQQEADRSRHPERIRAEARQKILDVYKILERRDPTSTGSDDETSGDPFANL